MVEITRRGMLGGGVAMGGLLWNTAALSSKSRQPPYGPAPAPLDGPELPSFRYPLGAQKTETFNGGTAKEANVTGFPVSEKLAGVYMTLAPGALRELHWHANAAEWAYVLAGDCRVTTIDPHGHSEIVDFGVGDVWYFPRGHGHSIQGLGPDALRFHPGIRQRLFLGFRHLQHHRLDRPRAGSGARQEFRRARRDLRQVSEEGSVYRQGSGAARACRPIPRQDRSNMPALTHRYRLLAAKPETFAGGTLRRVSAGEFPISSTMTGALLSSSRAGCANCIGIPMPPNGSTKSKAPGA